MAICVTHATALAQYPKGPGLLGPGGLDPRRGYGPPGIGSGYFGPSGPGSLTPTPSEPRPSDFISRTQGGSPAAPNQGASPPIPRELLEPMLNPPKIDLPFVPPTIPPVHAPGRPEPFAALSEIRWEWLAGIFVLTVLAAALLGYRGQKQTEP
jgi:hypothetical protein